MSRAPRPEAQPARAMIELFLEAYRLRLLRGLEDGLGRHGYGLIAGVDEVGRGCLAGPLVAAAVLFDYERLGPREVRALSLLNDSKEQGWGELLFDGGGLDEQMSSVRHFSTPVVAGGRIFVAADDQVYAFTTR